jgi:hypothetical protein
MPNTNRRRTTRHVTCVPAGVHTSEKERVGLIRDASAEGALLFCKSKFGVGDALTLSIRVDLDGENSVDVQGRIVRVERMKEGFWSFRIGVLFDPPREDLTPLFERLAETQERLFGSSR